MHAYDETQIVCNTAAQVHAAAALNTPGQPPTAHIGNADLCRGPHPQQLRNAWAARHAGAQHRRSFPAAPVSSERQRWLARQGLNLCCCSCQAGQCSRPARPSACQPTSAPQPFHHSIHPLRPPPPASTRCVHPHSAGGGAAQQLEKVGRAAPLADVVAGADVVKEVAASLCGQLHQGRQNELRLRLAVGVFLGSCTPLVASCSTQTVGLIGAPANASAAAA